MADRLILQDEDKKKKKSGLRLIPTGTIPAPEKVGPISVAPSLIPREVVPDQGAAPGRRLIPTGEIAAEEVAQKDPVSFINSFEQQMALSMHNGEYFNPSDEHLNAYISAKWGKGFTLPPLLPTATNVLKMLGEDFVINPVKQSIKDPVTALSLSLEASPLTPRPLLGAIQAARELGAKGKPKSEKISDALSKFAGYSFGIETDAMKEDTRLMPTMAEGVFRGGADLGMMGIMAKKNLFGVKGEAKAASAFLQKKLEEYRTHSPRPEKETRLSLRGYRSENPTGASAKDIPFSTDLSSVPDEIVQQWKNEAPGVFATIDDAKRNHWRQLNIIMTDRENARAGRDPLISQWLENAQWMPWLTKKERLVLAEKYKKQVVSAYSENASYWADPGGIASVVASVASKAPVAVSKSVVRGAVGKTTQRSGGLIESGGTAIRDIGEAATEKIISATDKITKIPGAGVAVSAASKPGVTARVVARTGQAIETVGQTVSSVGRIIESGPGQKGMLARMAMDKSIQHRAAFGYLEGLDGFLDFAVAGTKAGGTGVAVGGGLGALTGEGEFAVAGAVTGGTIGGFQAIPMKLLGSEAPGRMKNDVDSWLARQQDADVKAKLSEMNFGEQVTAQNLDAIVKGVMNEAGEGDVGVRFVTNNDDAVVGQERGAWINESGEVVINLSHKHPTRTIAHEVMHALEDIPNEGMQQAVSRLNAVLFDIVGSDGTVLRRGKYGIDDEIEFANQYQSGFDTEGAFRWRNEHKLSNESKDPRGPKGWPAEGGDIPPRLDRDSQPVREITKEEYLSNSSLRMDIQKEIRAESFSSLVHGSDVGSLMKKRFLDHILLAENGSKTMMLGKLLKKMGVGFDETGAPSSLFVNRRGEGITNNAQVNALLRDFVRARQKIKESISPSLTGEDSGFNVTSKELADPANSRMLEYYKDNDVFAKDSDGKLVMANGRPVRLSQKEISKLQKNRSTVMMDALEGVDQTGGIIKEVTEGTGKVTWRGRAFNDEQVKALVALPNEVLAPSLKEKLVFLNEQMKQGDATILFDYNAALSGRKYSSSISSAWRHDSPIGFRLTRAGNLVITGFNIDRVLGKISMWQKDKKGRFLDLWEGDQIAFRADLSKYMDNHMKGLPGDEGIGINKKDRINQLFDAPGSEVSRGTTIEGGRKPRLISSRRFDRINQMRAGDGGWHTDYRKMLENYMPATPEKGGTKYMPGRKEARSTTSGIRTIAKLASLNEPELFRSGLGSKAKDIESIAKHHSIPGQEIKVKPWTVDNDPYGSRRNRGDIKLQMTREGGHVSEVDITLHKDGNLHIDSSMADSNLMKGGGGDQLYQIPLDFAFHNDKIRIPDPSGLSEVASKRLIPQLLSSGLKHKSFKHIGDPALKSDTGANPTKLVAPWDPKTLPEGMSAFDYKAGVLALTELKNVQKVFPEISSFQVDPKSGLLTGNVDGKTQTYHRGEKSIGGSDSLAGLVKQIRSRPGGDFIGETTLIRSAGYMAQDGGGYSSLLLGHGEQAKPGVPKLPRPSGLDRTFYMPAGRAEKANLKHQISTRFPTAVARTDDPLAGILNIGLDTIKGSKDQLKNHASIIRKYPGVKIKSRSPEVAVEEFINHGVGNLLWLHDLVPEGTRNRSAKWYDGANSKARKMVKEYGTEVQGNAGALAALSPQKDWFMNVSLSERVVDISTNQRGTKFGKDLESWLLEWGGGDPKIQALAKSLKGKSFDQLNDYGKSAFIRAFDEVNNSRSYDIVSPEGKVVGIATTKKGDPAKVAWGSMSEINKALRITLDPSSENISKLLGNAHKVRNFYNNILLPNADGSSVTIDTHAVAAALLRPLAGNDLEVGHNFGTASPVKNSSITGAQGTYGIYAEMYRRAATERGILPRQMQSITWEAVRGLYEAKWKTKSNKNLIDKIWKQHETKGLSLDETRQRILDESGGITPPEWERSGGAAVKGAGPAGDTGKLSPSQLRQGRTGDDARARGRTPRDTSSKVDYMPAGKGGDIFYSNSSKALDSPKVRKLATGPAMLNDILKVDPAAGQEMKWIDLDRWLMDKKGKVTKEEVQKFIDANQIGVFEKTRKGDTGAAPEEITHYENKIRDLEDELAGAENRDDAFAAQERVDIEGELEAARSELESLNKEGGPLHDKPELVLPGAKKGSYRELELMLPKRKGEQFTQSHFKGDENVFAHVRSNERTDADGKRMLFIEEAQSDWAAAGRDKGFGTEPRYVIRFKKDGSYFPMEEQFSNRADAEKYLARKEAEFDGMNKGKLKVVEEQVTAGRVPEAPFVSKRKGGKFVEDDRWRMLAMKRMIRMAADEGYDRLGWINGRDTAERNNMGNYVSELEWQRLPGEDRVMISAKNKEGDLVIKGKDFQVKDLADVVGKELAGKILKSNELSGEYSGLDLHTGGVFWKRFYDEKLPSYVRRYTSKWKGAKVGEVGIDAGDFKVMKKNFNGGPYFSLESRSSPDSISNHPTAEAAWAEAERLGGTTAHYVDITPQMKADVQQGQAMFMPAGGKGGKVKRKGSATSRKPGARIPMGAVAKQLRLERDLKKLKRN